MYQQTKGLYAFGKFRFDPEKKVLWSEGQMLALTPKATDVLSVLLSEHGNLVERQQLIERVWSDTFVEDGNLNQAISALRKALGNDLIQTVPRRGYRFAGDVRRVEPGGVPELVIERKTVSRTIIEEREEVLPVRAQLRGVQRRWPYIVATSGILLVVLAASLWFFRSRPRTSAARQSIQSIAVLPLRSFAQDSADEELRLRITDAIITKLGRLDDLVVTPTSSVLRFKDSDVMETGKALGVEGVLDGRIQQENGRLRVTLQLISTATGQQIWSGHFDGRAGEILALQDSIADRIRRDMSFTAAADKRLHAIDNEAYEAYLRGRFLWNQRKQESYYKALEYFEKSVQIDPNFALGYCGIADTYYLLQQRNAISTLDAFSKAEPAARKALDLEPGLSEPNVSMGIVSYIRYGQWTEAERFYRRAIELDPNAPEAYARLGMLLNAWSRFAEAQTVLEKAVELDPTSLNNAIYLGANFYFSNRLDLAEAQFKKILEFAPGTERAHFFLQRIYELKGQYDEAVEHALAERSLIRRDSVEPLRTAYEKGGIRAFWAKQIEVLNAESASMFGLENHIASRYVLLGDFDKACDYVEINLENYGGMRHYGRVDPLFYPLHSVPRYQRAMSRHAPPA